MAEQLDIDVAFGDAVASFSLPAQTPLLALFQEHLCPLWGLDRDPAPYCFGRESPAIDQTPIACVSRPGLGRAQIALLARADWERVHQLSAQHLLGAAVHSALFPPVVQAHIVEVGRWRRLLAQCLDEELIGCGMSILPEHFFDIEEDEARMAALLAWLKDGSPFRSAADPPACAVCGAATRAHGFGERTHAEVRAQVFNVRLFKCTDPACAALTRVPRHAALERLLEVWYGEEQELLLLFVFFATVLQADARVVVAVGGHVCSEFWSQARGRYVDLALDGALDRPLLHAAQGRHRFVAVGVRGAADVSKRYTIDWDEALVARGREIGEEDWAPYVRLVNEVTLDGLDEEGRQLVATRQAQDAAAIDAELEAIPIE
jgi:hypothetical protein